MDFDPGPYGNGPYGLKVKTNKTRHQQDYSSNEKQHSKQIVIVLLFVMTNNFVAVLLFVMTKHKMLCCFFVMTTKKSPSMRSIGVLA